MDPFESPWESWIRPLLVIALVVGLGVAWWVGWLPDAALGLLLTGAALLIPGVLALREHWRPAGAGRWLAAALAAAALTVAAWAPSVVLGPDGQLAAGHLTGPEARLPLPARAGGPGRVMVYVHGEPSGERAQVEVVLDLPGAGGHHAHRGDLVDRLVGGRGGAKAVRNTEIVWPVRVDLARGGAVGLTSEHPDRVAWPVQVEVREAPPGGKPFMLASGLLALLACAVDARRRPRGAALTWIAFGSGVFSAAFAYWYAPGALVKTAFASALAAMVAGLLVSWPLVFAVRRLTARRATTRLAA